MMDSINFLKEGLKELYSSLSYLEIKYEYRTNILTHIIEVKPIHCYERDNLYIEKQNALEEKFSELFPYEEILFMTENILIQIEKPILELGNSQIILNSPEIVEEDVHSEFIHIDFELTELFNTLIKVNTRNESYSYLHCSEFGTESLNYEEFYKVAISDINYVNEPQNQYKKLKNTNNSLKKDSEIKQSLFFC